MKSNFTLMFACLIILGFVVTSFAKPQVQSQINSVQSSASYEYATLFYDGSLANFQAGETNDVIQTLSADQIYRRLGGKSRFSLNNMLNAIGSDGWELVATDQTNWTFKRRK